MTATDSYMLLRAFFDELARCGLSDATTSPGSRCAPIVLSLVRESRIRSWSHIDERCAGFFALGAAKASGRPVAVTCTSGTAAANLAPAVHEAFQAQVPLIVLTADRPAELREVGAGQTIDQLKLYGTAAKWFLELDLGSSDVDRLRWMRTVACRAYWTALEEAPGPVHLNFPLREPLVLDQPLPDDQTGRDDGSPWVRPDTRPSPTRPRDSDPRSGDFHPLERAVIVAGRDERDPELGAGIAAVADQAGIPLLADPLSGARRGEAAIAHYDLLLRDPAFAASHRPRFVLRVGDLPTSKPLRGWLADLNAAQIAIGRAAAWRDPGGVVGMHVASSLSELTAGLDLSGRDRGWLEDWRSHDQLAADAIGSALGGREPSEPNVARLLGACLPPEAILFVASSMPIRDVEAFLPVLERPPRVLSNRGANGIDGTVSSAFGAAAASERPVVLLVGDVALAHDLGGLLAAKRLGLSLTIVVLNNDGGGIFHFLPVAGEQDAFEAHVATPHGLRISDVARLFTLSYERAETVAGLRKALDTAFGAATTSIIEVPGDRERNLAVHRELAAAVRAAVT